MVRRKMNTIDCKLSFVLIKNTVRNVACFRRIFRYDLKR